LQLHEYLPVAFARSSADCHFVLVYYQGLAYIYQTIIANFSLISWNVVNSEVASTSTPFSVCGHCILSLPSPTVSTFDRGALHSILGQAGWCGGGGGWYVGTSSHGLVIARFTPSVQNYRSVHCSYICRTRLPPLQPYLNYFSCRLISAPIGPICSFLIKKQYSCLIYIFVHYL
jgi:hypothetical protein